MILTPYVMLKPNVKTAIKNLLSVSGMSLSNVTQSGGTFTFNSGTTAMVNQSLPTPIVGHKYYGRVSQRVDSGTTFLDGRFEYFFTDAAGTGNIVFTSFSAATADGQWHTYSDILSFTGLSSQTGWILRSFAVNGTKAAYRKEHMIIDLTAAFGAGNEPTKEWCDANIPFFEGTIQI